MCFNFSVPNSPRFSSFIPPRWSYIPCTPHLFIHVHSTRCPNHIYFLSCSTFPADLIQRGIPHTHAHVLVRCLWPYCARSMQLLRCNVCRPIVFLRNLEHLYRFPQNSIQSILLIDASVLDHITPQKKYKMTDVIRYIVDTKMITVQYLSSGISLDESWSRQWSSTQRGIYEGYLTKFNKNDSSCLYQWLPDCSTQGERLFVCMFVRLFVPL